MIMKTLDTKMKAIMEMSSALMLYVAKGWKVRFDTQLDKLEFQRLSNYKFDQGYGEFRYDGFMYKVFDDRIIYRSLSSVDEHIIKHNQLKNIQYNV